MSPLVFIGVGRHAAGIDYRLFVDACAARHFRVCAPADDLPHIFDPSVVTDIVSHAIGFFQGQRHEQRVGRLVQRRNRLGLIQPDDNCNDVFVHIDAVERAGLDDLREGHKPGFEPVPDRRTGRCSEAELVAL